MVVRAADGSCRRWWLGFGAGFCACVLSARPAIAQEVTRECSRLSDARWQELEARLRVVLGVHGRAELAVQLRCDPTAAEVVIFDHGDATRLPLAPHDDLVEAALAAVEAELARRSTAKAASSASAAPPAPSEPAGAGSPPSPAPPTRVASPPARVEPKTIQSERDAPVLSGGIGLGIGGESWGSDMPAFGPRLHLALGHADWCVVAVESLGFGPLEHHAALTFSTEIGASFGAPYAPLRSFGAQLLLGHEWLSASENAATPSQTSGVWSVAFGVRGAVPVAPVSFFIGPDFRLRLGENALGPPLSVGLPAYSVLVQAGAFWIQEAMRPQR